MDFSAIRSRLAGSDGRLYWRSLGELADTLQFREYLHREFPEQASQWNDPQGRRQFLKLMSASLALAGVQPGVMRMFDRSGLTDAIGQANFFWSADQAILAAEKQLLPAAVTQGEVTPTDLLR